MNARFVVVAPESKKGMFTVKLPIVVGRSEEAKFRIQQDRVSRKHCEFFNQDGIVYLRDLGSTNGTFLNDEQVAASEKTPVNSGAVVRVGGLAFRVEYDMPPGLQTAAGRERPTSADDTVGVKQGGDSEPLRVEHLAETAIPSAVTETAAAEEAMFEEPASEEPAAEASEEASEPEAAEEQPNKKGKTFDFLAAEPPADEESADAAQWPAGDGDADAGEGPPDDDKLGDFFKGLK